MVASFLWLIGLSFLAVVTGVVMSAFVTQAQEDRRTAGEDPMFERLEDLTRDVALIKAEVLRRGEYLGEVGR